MSLRNKEALEKLFAESRERVAKRKEKEAQRRREKRRKNRAQKSIFSMEDDDNWFEIHSMEIISKLSNKKVLNDREKELLHCAFDAAYPNGL